MLKFKDELITDYLEPLKIIVAENYQHRKQFINVPKNLLINKIKKADIKEYLNDLIHDFNSIDELISYDTFILNHYYFLYQLLYYIDSKEVKDQIKEGSNLETSINKCIQNDLISYFEEYEGDEL